MKNQTARRWLYAVLTALAMSTTSVLLVIAIYRGDASKVIWWVQGLAFLVYIFQTRFLIFGPFGLYQNRVDRIEREKAAGYRR